MASAMMSGSRYREKRWLLLVVGVLLIFVMLPSDVVTRRPWRKTPGRCLLAGSWGKTSCRQGPNALPVATMRGTPRE